MLVMKYISCLTFVLLFLFVNIKGENTFQLQNRHKEIKSQIEEWWKENNNQIKRNCVDLKTTLPKLPVKGPNAKLRIRGFNCPQNTDPSLYLFNGLDKSHYPDGKGKLRLISKAEWSTWPDIDKDSLFERNVCYEMYEKYEMKYSGVKEIIGTFKNGSLEGKSKIKWYDNSTIISKFKDGYLHGFYRSWNGTGRLESVENYKKGSIFGKSWHIVMDHLLYSNEDVLSLEEERDTVVFPILSNGSLDDPMVGNFLPHLNVLDDVHKIQLTGIESGKEECMLKFKYNKIEEEDFRYVLRMKKEFPLSYHRSLPLCNIKTNSNLDAPSKQLYKLFEYVDNVVYGKNDSVVVKYSGNESFSAYQPFFEGYQILFHLKPLSEDIDHSTARQLITNITFNETKNSNTAIIFGSEHPLRIDLHEFHLNKRLELDGYCDISIAIQDRNLIPRDTALDWPPYRIKGMFRQGKLNGIALIETDTQSFGWVTMKDNVMHGPVVFQGIMPVNPDQVKEIFSEKIKDGKMIMPQFLLKKGTRFLGYYKNGFADGTFWIGMLGGFPSPRLHGTISNTIGYISGNNLSYIFPDMETSYVGKFENRVMREARYAKVKELKCDANGLPYVSTFSNESLDAIFYYKPPSNVSFGAGPEKIRDPYEDNLVYSDTSAIPNSGEGLFLKKDVRSQMLITSYLGYVYGEEEIEIYDKHCAMNISKSDDERRHCVKYKIGIAYLDKKISIPPEVDVPETYFRSLGPKVNHNFELNNTYFYTMDHPRWGLIQSVVASRDIKAGEELFGHYGYERGKFPSDFPWYFELKNQIEKEHRLKQRKKKGLDNKKDRT